MKLIKLKHDHFVIVDDSEIKEGDFVYDSKDKVIRFVKQYLPDEWIKKITHSTHPLYENDFWAIQELKLSEVKELIGEVDVEKKVKDYVEELIDCKSVKESERTWISAICYQMYNQALEDNKEKKYTEKDIDKAYWAGMQFVGEDKGSFGEFIQSLQPKTEWEVEFNTNGKLKLKI